MEKDSEQKIKVFISKSLFDEEIILKKDPSFPKISIVITSYNQAKFLQRTILSILNQNYPNLEFIVIDGGSSDQSVDIIKKYERYLTYWVSEKDRGQSDGLNKGFKKATGEIIGTLNSDDIFLPEALHKIAEFFKKNPKTDIVYSNRLDIDENDNLIGESRFAKFSRIVWLYDGMSLGSQGVFWKKKLFSKVGLLDINLHFAMDYEFFFRMALAGAKFKHVPGYFGAMRRHKNAKTEMFLGTPCHQKECNQVNQKYGKKKWLNFPLKIYSLFFRTLHYLLQGDIDYVLRGLKRRVKNKSIFSGR